MEIIIGLIIVAVIFWVIKAIASNSNNNQSRSTRETSSNIPPSIPPSMQTNFRIVENSFTNEAGDHTFDVFDFQMKGIIPHNVAGKDSVVSISLFDEEEKLLVMSILDSDQEYKTRFFMHRESFPSLELGSGTNDWVSIGFVPKETLIPPRSGQRRLRTIIRFTRPGSEKNIYRGQLSDESDLYYIAVEPDPSVTNLSKFVKFDFQGIGYIEEGENAEIAQKMGIKLALSLAVIDGELHESEGLVIKNWLTKFIEDYPEGENKERIKSEMNTAMEQDYVNAVNKTIDRDETIKTLKDVGQKIDYFETLELLIDIMAADNDAHGDELEFVNHVGQELGVSSRELQDMKGMKIAGAESLTVDPAFADEQLGISEDMSQEDTCKHIQTEFLTWNSRLMALQTGSDRDYAQNMIDMLAEARVKHCG